MVRSSHTLLVTSRIGGVVVYIEKGNGSLFSIQRITLGQMARVCVLSLINMSTYGRKTGHSKKIRKSARSHVRFVFVGCINSNHSIPSDGFFLSYMSIAFILNSSMGDLSTFLGLFHVDVGSYGGRCHAGSILSRDSATVCKSTSMKSGNVVAQWAHVAVNRGRRAKNAYCKDRGEKLETGSLFDERP